MKRPSLLGIVARLGAAAVIGHPKVQLRVADADEQARKLIYARRNDPFDRAMPALTDYGSTYATIGAASVLFAFGKRALARNVLIAGLGTWAVAQVTKPVFRRARPYEVDEIELWVRKPAGLSYPSGHPAVAAAVARQLEPEVRGPARGLIERIPRVVAFSRVYVGVHYPTDVIGGLLMGRALGDLVRRYGAR